MGGASQRTEPVPTITAVESGTPRCHMCGKTPDDLRFISEQTVAQLQKLIDEAKSRVTESERTYFDAHADIIAALRRTPPENTKFTLETLRTGPDAFRDLIPDLDLILEFCGTSTPRSQTRRPPLPREQAIAAAKYERLSGKVEHLTLAAILEHVLDCSRSRRVAAARRQLETTLRNRSDFEAHSTELFQFSEKVVFIAAAGCRITVTTRFCPVCERLWDEATGWKRVQTAPG